MKEIWKQYKERFIINGYKKTGYMYGECISYLIYDINPRWFFIPFSWFEKKYYNMGYVLITADQWMMAGGYNANIDHLFQVERTVNEMHPGDIQLTEVKYMQSEDDPNVVYYDMKFTPTKPVDYIEINTAVVSGNNGLEYKL